MLKKNGPSTVMPVSKAIVFKLLNSVDRSSWMENRNYLILSLLWALGLRVSELTRLVIGSFEPGHGPNIGRLRVKGKNKKQRALFVVDKLYNNLMHYKCSSKCSVLFGLCRPVRGIIAQQINQVNAHLQFFS
jgi:integrase/recombinase XerD